ncbi:hypothetical protein N2152v2_006789 [Parachlorella kessleri]
MLISKKNRREVYKFLFKEGVLYAEKDFNLPEHPEIEGVSNLEVIKLMQSMKSKDLVSERYAWRHYYWFLTDAGIEHLREYLNLPSEIVPATLKKSTRPLEREGARPPRGDRPPRRFDGEGRGGYRSAEGKTGAPGEYRPEFRGGFGRGSAPPQGLDRNARVPPRPNRRVLARYVVEKNGSAAVTVLPTAAADGQKAAELDSYLRQQGLNPAELKQQQPEAYQQLTLGLAAVLCQIYAAIAAAEDEQGSEKEAIRPADLMARICLFTQQLCFTPADVLELWTEKPQVLRFRLEDYNLQREAQQLSEALAWLGELGLSRQEAAGVWRRQLPMFRLPATALRHNLRALLLRCPLSPEQQRRFVEDSGRLLASECDSLLSKLDSLLAVVPGIGQELGPLVASSGLELGGKLDAVLRKVAYMRKYGFSKEQLAGIVKVRPEALLGCGMHACSPACELCVKNVLMALEVVLASPEAVVQAVCGRPKLLTTTPSVIARMADTVNPPLDRQNF